MAYTPRHISHAAGRGTKGNAQALADGPERTARTLLRGRRRAPMRRRHSQGFRHASTGPAAARRP